MVIPARRRKSSWIRRIWLHLTGDTCQEEEIVVDPANLAPPSRDVVRVVTPGMPNFQLRAHEPGLSVFDTQALRNSMELNKLREIEVSWELIEGLKSFRLQREVEHCGMKFLVPPFDFYAQCPRCGTRMKVRSLSALMEIEDVFDAVFEWMLQPGAADLVRRRQEEIEADKEA